MVAHKPATLLRRCKLSHVHWTNRNQISYGEAGYEPACLEHPNDYCQCGPGSCNRASATYSMFAAPPWRAPPKTANKAPSWMFRLPTKSSRSPHDPKGSYSTAGTVQPIRRSDGMSGSCCVSRTLCGQIEKLIPARLTDSTSDDGRAVAISLRSRINRQPIKNS